MFDPRVDHLRDVASHTPLYPAGAAADHDLARRADAMYLEGDLVECASSLRQAVKA